MFKMIRNKVQDMFETHVEELVRSDHPYRKLLAAIDFKKLCKPLKALFHETLGRKGYHVESGFAALVLQWMEDLSDRELERFLQENNAGKLFCGFSLLEKTPDHSYFSVLRSKIGTKRLGALFEAVNKQLRSQGLISDIFNFVDASQIISKINLWGERDKAIEAGLEKFNNITASKVATDPQARIGCKGNKNYWYGYKRNVAVCMKFGFISKVAITPANVTDGQALKHVCPKQGVTYADKAYCDQTAQNIMKINGCESRAILKDNMKKKDFIRDSEISKKRMPFERVFSKQSKRARYKGICKNQFQGFMQALVFNFKRLISLNDLVVQQK
jgi:transposase, IS5 family